MTLTACPKKANSPKRCAALFINVGTPRSTHPLDIARYLREFLTDRRVINLPWLRRQLLVHFVIIPSRLISSRKNYCNVWKDGTSPLVANSQSFIETLEPFLRKENITPFLAMRYQEPSLRSTLDEIERFSPDRLLVVPLYPQYASATTGSSIEACMKHLKRWQILPEVSFLTSFSRAPWFLDAWTNILRPHLRPGSHVVYCFHGLPMHQVSAKNYRGTCNMGSCCSDENMQSICYVAQCRTTASDISQRLNLTPSQWSSAFQSRLGKERWTEPYLSDHLVRLTAQGISDIVLVSPSFVADCVETLDELGREARALFLEHGGRSCEIVPSLNNDPTWIEGVAKHVIHHFMEAF